MSASDVRRPELGGLSRLEVAYGLAIGSVEDPVRFPDVADPATSPRAALEAAVRPHLERTPCCVAFSGGRDSSLILAVATAVARREGLALPVPVTWRHPDPDDAGRDSNETEWQEAVIRHLRLDEWERVTVDLDEMDLLGPLATQRLLTRGFEWPERSYMKAPLYRIATGGTLLTGEEGDGLMGGWRFRAGADVRAGRIPLSRPALRRLAQATVPQPLVARRRSQPTFADLAWLTADANRELNRLLHDQHRSEPQRWDARVRWYRNRRYLAFLLASERRQAAGFDVVYGTPLLDESFLAGLAASSPRDGHGTRTAIIALLAGGDLPADVITRRTKAHFQSFIWGPATRAFVDGLGDDLPLDWPELDPAGLLAEWHSEQPVANSFALLHAAWLSEH